MLIHIPNVLTAQEAAEFRRRLDAADWADGRETAGAQGMQVKHNMQLPDASPLRAELARAVLAALKHSPLFFAAALPHKILPPRFNRYADGGSYGFHTDGGVMNLAEGDYLRSDISCTLFLNDPDEYDGGRLVIEDSFGEHAVALPAGDAILYPSSSLHRVEPVTRGARLASFFWVQSLVRGESQRRMLFDLDMSIQALTEQGADRPTILKLTNVYHNLLRRWSDT